MFSYIFSGVLPAVRTATVKFRRRLQLGLFSMILMLLSLNFMSAAVAATQDLEFNSPAGYVIKTSFSYDENYAKNHASKMIREQGKGKTKLIDSMQVSFYNPSGEMIASYDNIVAGVAQGKYFEFGFDPLTHRLAGNIDFGGESAGEIYLKGIAESELSLIEVAPTGEERVIDRLEPLSSDVNRQ